MLDAVLNSPLGSPEFGLFLAVGLGHWAGHAKVAGVRVGTATAAMVCGLLLGHVWPEPNASLRSAFFLLFLFSMGYSVGPHIGWTRNRHIAEPVALSIVVVTSGLVTSLLLARGLGLDPGIAAGLFSGGMTASSAMGTAIDAIRDLALPVASAKAMADNVVIANALCYVFGTMGTVLFAAHIGPRLMDIDLSASARRLEHALGIEKSPHGVFSAQFRFLVRSVRLRDGAPAIGRSVFELERLDPGRTVFIVRVLRDGQVFEAFPNTVLAAGDAVALFGHAAAVIACGREFGDEVVADDLQDFPIEVLGVVVTNGRLCGLSSIELRQRPETRCVTIRSVTRGGQAVPLGAGTRLQPGDTVELIGPMHAVERLAGVLGTPLRPSAASPIATIGIGVFLGGVIGAPSLLAGNITLTLGPSVGVLVCGIAAGWLRTRCAGRLIVPEPAERLMIDLGAAVFVAGAGMQAGPSFLPAAAAFGPVLLLAGAVVTLVPQAVGFAFGRYILKMNPVLLLGALAGAQTSTGALVAVQAASGSHVAVLGYTTPYAASTVLLTFGGALMIALST